MSVLIPLGLVAISVLAIMIIVIYMTIPDSLIKARRWPNIPLKYLQLGLLISLIIMLVSNAAMTNFSTHRQLFR